MVGAWAILAFGAWFALKGSVPPTGWTGYAPLSDMRLGTPILDQAPLRVGVAMACAVIATVMVTLAVRQPRHP
jgi:hypothetical protein